MTSSGNEDFDDSGNQDRKADRWPPDDRISQELSFARSVEGNTNWIQRQNAMKRASGTSRD